MKNTSDMFANFIQEKSQSKGTTNIQHEQIIC
jgi:hypothetical protein